MEILNTIKIGQIATINTKEAGEIIAAAFNCDEHLCNFHELSKETKFTEVTIQKIGRKGSVLRGSCPESDHKTESGVFEVEISYYSEYNREQTYIPFKLWI